MLALAQGDFFKKSSRPGRKLSRKEAAGDHPDEALRFRQLQLQDENGEIAPDGLQKALDQMAAMNVAQAREAKASGRAVPPKVAGIDPGAWTWLGPGNIGGRIRSMVIDPTNANRIWVGSVGGGIWRSTDAGVSWQPVAGFSANLAVSSMVIDPTNASVLYAGTGESFAANTGSSEGLNPAANGLRGNGVYKSTDAGVTWSQLPTTRPGDPAVCGGGPAPTSGCPWSYVNRLAISPDGSTLLAATVNGTQRSTDGGATWSATPSFSGNIQDCRFSPTNSGRAIASRPSPSAARYSTDGGQSWISATFTPPLNASAGGTGRIELAYAPSNPSIVYASVDQFTGAAPNQTQGDIYKSLDGGQTYTRVNASNPGNTFLGGQGGYDNVIWVNPFNPNFVVLGGINIYRSTDGGLNWTAIANGGNGSAHSDHHGIFASSNFDNTSNKTVYFTNDGGIYRANDVSTVTLTSGWQALNNTLGVTQFYGATASADGVIVGGTQDNGTVRYTGDPQAWTTMFGGDGGFCAADQTDNTYFYGEYINLGIVRSNDGGASASYIYCNPVPTSPNGGPCTGAGITDAFNGANFIAPFILDPSNQTTMLAGGLSLWRSNDIKAAGLPTWAAVKAPTGNASPVSAITIAPNNSDFVVVGHNDGQIFLTFNATAASPNWSKVSNGTPARFVTRLVIDSTRSPNWIYATFGGFSSDNIYRSQDFGATWTSVAGAGATGVPSVPVRSLVINPLRADYLYVGTEIGVFASEDAGATWKVPHDGPANVSVDELFWQKNNLVAVTHGRGLYRAGASLNWTGSGNTNRWSNADNWGPAPPATGDTLAFGASPQTMILADFSSRLTSDPAANDRQPALSLSSITFASGAPPYTIELYSAVTGGFVYNANLILTGLGVINNSGQAQNFLLDAGTVGINAPAAPASTMTFSNSASAGSATYTLKGGETTQLNPGIGLLRSEAAALFFNNTATAASGNFVVNGGAGNGGRWARVELHDATTASTATFTNGAGRPGPNFQNQSPASVDGFGGQTNFYNNAVAGTARFTNLGETATGGNGGGTQFFDNTNADHGVFMNNSSPSGNDGGTGGFTSFAGTASAGFGVFIGQPGLGTFSRGQTGFFENSTAGNGTFENTGGDNTYSSGGVTFFRDNATAGNGTFNNYGTGQLSFAGGQTLFYDNSNAGAGTFTNVGGIFGPPGTIEFAGNSSAANGTFYVTVSNRGGLLNFRNNASAGQGHFFTPGGGGDVNFYNSSTAANSTFNLASNSISGPFVRFRDQSNAGNASFDVSPSGNLQFYETSSAAQSHIVLRGFGAGPGGGASLYVLSTLGNSLVDMEGATASSGTLNSGGPGASFSGSAATAGDAVINVKGGTAAGAAGATLQFGQFATAGNATITIGGGSNGGSGGSVLFSGYYGLVSGGTSRIIANAGGTLQVSGNIPNGTPAPEGTSFGSIEGAGTFILGNTLLVTGTRNTNTTVSGVITDGGSGFSAGGMLTKVGSGTFTLSGPNSYTGLTKVNAGKLIVNGSIPGAVRVASGATLGGSGSIGGAVTLDPGGILSPGNSPGTISLGSLALAAGSSLLMEIGGTTPGTTYDAVSSASNISLDGTLTISLTNGFTPAPGNTFNILTAAGTVSGAFSNVVSGARLHDADGSGSFLVTVNSGGVTLSSYLGPASNFSSWQNGHFTPQQLNDPTISGPNQDPDGDGVSNLLEYALNGDPLDAASNNRPVESHDATYFSIIYTRVLAASDLDYQVQQATSVGSWSNVTPVNQILSDNGFVQVIKAQVPRSNALGGKLFLRLSVTKL